MSKDVEYELDLICDSCGHKGAFEFYGDFVCSDCLSLDDDEDEIGEFDED